MKRVIGAAAAVVGLTILFACRGGGTFRSRTFPPQKMKKDWTVIGIHMDGNACKVLQAKPDDMRIARQDDLTWFVDGNCPDVDIAINPVVRDAQGREHTIAGKLRDKATHKQRLFTRLAGELPEGQYTYEILIGGKPAEYRSPAQRGAFSICPDWPCS